MVGYISPHNTELPRDFPNVAIFTPKPPGRHGGTETYTALDTDITLHCTALLSANLTIHISTSLKGLPS